MVQHTITMLSDEAMVIATICPMCAQTFKVLVRIAAYNAWLKGELIQNVMPELSAALREQLVSGTCSACWDSLFKEE